MAQVSIGLNEIAPTAGRALDEVAAGAAATLDDAAGLLDARAGRLAAAAGRLREALGEDHPEVVALEQAAAVDQALGAAARDAAGRQARRPTPGADEWLVFGRVLRRDGAPASDVQVRVTSADGKLKDNPAGPTDELGDFHVAYRRGDFPASPATVGELFVLVEDRKGKLLHRSGEPVRFAPGRAEYLELTLGEPPAPARRAARKAPRRSTTERSPRTRKTTGGGKA